MALLSRQRVVLTGLNPSFVAADAAGDSFSNLVVTSENTFFAVKNGGVSACQVTIAEQGTCNRGEVHNRVVSVPAGEERWIGPLGKTTFNDDQGEVQVTYDQVTSVTVGAFGVPNAI